MIRGVLVSLLDQALVERQLELRSLCLFRIWRNCKMNHAFSLFRRHTVHADMFPIPVVPSKGVIHSRVAIITTRTIIGEAKA